MSYTNIRVVRANGCPREDIIEPHKKVRWKIPGWQGGPVIFSDSGSIFIYDFQYKVLNVFVDWSYIAHKMISVKTYGTFGSQMVHAEIQLTDPKYLIAVDQMDSKLKRYLLKMVQNDPETLERLSILKN